MNHKLLQTYVDAQAQTRPEQVALVYENRSVTYGSLGLLSNQLARLLKASGFRKGDRIAILLPKSPAAIISMLAVLKADCIYVPMDVSNPTSRLKMILESSDCSCILAAHSSAKALNELIASGAVAPSVRIGWIDETHETESETAFSWTDIPSMPGESLDYDGCSDDIAHILFTSGSTGQPKGVMITHDNVRCFVEWAVPYFGITSSDRISGHPPLHFDLSTFDIYGTFAAGSQLHLVPPQLSLLPHKIAELIRNAELTQWFSVPSLLNYMAKFDVVRWNDFPSLRRLLWCGEQFPTPALMYWMNHLPHVSFTNLYGPTEATIASSYYTVPACPKGESDAVPIGAACEGEELHVLDGDLQPLLPGQIGDLYIGGVGLSPGYWRDPAKTAAAFLPNPLGTRAARIYKTGDLATIGEDGLVYLHGRADSQIKSRGYRIELGEIEAVLNTTDGIRECAVVAINSGDFEGSTICCALVPAENSEINPQLLRRRLSERLPSYMIPSRWMSTQALPLNGNGKIDRPKLRQDFQVNTKIVTA